MSDEVRKRFFVKVRKSSACWNWVGVRDPNGYGRFYLRGKMEQAHRVMWRMANGEIPDGKWVLHQCDNKSCVRPEHLELGDQSKNMKDAFARGRAYGPRGERNPNAKLTAEQVVEIRALPRSISSAQIAERYGVASCTIRYVRQRTTWGWL